MRRIIQSDLFDEEYSIIHAYKYMVQRFPSVMMDPREYGSFTGSGRGVLRRVIAEEAYQSKEVDDELESRKEIDCGWGDEAESHFQLNVDESDSAPASPHSDWEDMQREESDDNDSEMGYSQTPVQASKQLEQQSKIMHDLEYVEKFMNTNVPLLHSGASLIRDLKTTDPDIKKQAKTLRAVTKYLKRLNIQIVTAENL